MKAKNVPLNRQTSVKLKTSKNSLNNSRTCLNEPKNSKIRTNPKFLKKVDRNMHKTISLSNISSTRSIGGEVRESIKTKTMTRMKQSFESSTGSDHLSEFLHSKISKTSQKGILFSPDSTVNGVSLFLSQS